MKDYDKSMMKNYDDSSNKKYAKQLGDCGNVKEYKEEKVMSYSANGGKKYSTNNVKDLDKASKELAGVVKNG